MAAASLASEAVSLAKEAGLLAKEAGLLAKEAGLLAKEAGLLAKEAGLLAKEAGLLAKEAGLLAKEAGLLAKEAGLLAKEAGLLAKEAGLLAKEAGLLAHEAVLLVNEAVLLANEAVLLANEAVLLAIEAGLFLIATTSFLIATALFLMATALFLIATTSLPIEKKCVRVNGNLERWDQASRGPNETPSGRPTAAERKVRIMSTSSKPKPSLGVARVNVPGVLARAGIMETAIVLAAALFPSLPIAMTAFLLLIQAAAAAQSATATRANGLASLRDTKVDALWTAMLNLKAYIGGLASAMDANAATSLIEAAGLLVAQTAVRAKLLFSATFVPATGVVHLSVNALLLVGKRSSKKTTFTYSWSVDGGKTWSAGVTTGYTSLDVPGLPAATYLFRVFATVGKIPGEPTQAVSLTIH